MGFASRLKAALRARPKSVIHRKARKATVAFCLLADDGRFLIVGSGVMAHGSGVVLTAAHVLRGMAEDKEQLEEEGHEVSFRVMVTSNPRTMFDADEGAVRAEAELSFIGLDQWLFHEERDLAVVTTTGSGMNAPTLPINNRRVVKRGCGVGACGYPYGLDPHEGRSVLNSCLTGHVSGVAPVPTAEPDHIRHYLLQMPVNPGNSGGPVFSPRTGEVFAIVSRRFQPGGIPSGLCIAVPVHGVEQVVREAA